MAASASEPSWKICRVTAVWSLVSARIRGVVTTGKGSELASELVLLADWLVLLLVSSALTQTGLKEPKIKKPKAKPCIIVVFFILTPFWWQFIWPTT